MTSLVLGFQITLQSPFSNQKVHFKNISRNNTDQMSGQLRHCQVLRGRQILPSRLHGLHDV